jgi:hypothetical protein
MRASEELKGIDGLEYIASAPSGEIIKHMAMVDGVLFVATDRHLYALEDGKRLENVD